MKAINRRAAALICWLAAWALPAQAGADGQREYVIGGGDSLQVNVWKNAELSQSVVVRPDGKITLPLVRDVQAEGLTAVPEEVETLVVSGPRELDERTRFAVDQFVMRGGRAVFLVDHFEMPAGSLDALPVESGVHDLLERYGAKVARDVVGEPRLNAPAAFSSGFMQFRIAYPSLAANRPA